MLIFMLPFIDEGQGTTEPTNMYQEQARDRDRDSWSAIQYSYSSIETTGEERANDAVCVLLGGNQLQQLQQLQAYKLQSVAQRTCVSTLLASTTLVHS